MPISLRIRRSCRQPPGTPTSNRQLCVPTAPTDESLDLAHQFGDAVQIDLGGLVGQTASLPLDGGVRRARRLAGCATSAPLDCARAVSVSFASVHCPTGVADRKSERLPKFGKPTGPKTMRAMTE